MVESASLVGGALGLEVCRFLAVFLLHSVLETKPEKLFLLVRPARELCMLKMSVLFYVQEIIAFAELEKTDVLQVLLRFGLVDIFEKL